MPAPRASADVGGLRALAHPLRLRLLSLLTAAPYSAAEAARALDETQANVSYHLRKLYAAGLLDLVAEESVRGGRAKRYQHDPDSGERLGTGSPEDHRMLAAVLGEELSRRTAHRLPDSRGELTDAELWLAPEDWERVRELARELSVELHNAARPPGTPEAVRVSAMLLMFPMTIDQPSATEPPQPPGASRTSGASGWSYGRPVRPSAPESRG
ncbi:helix-turn-helix domain-containing protein [Streptomyces oceani]|uniref:helix-turn-helix domain-containing protein n=1 Tax=Streptomyces oceani TaxID=1075402 RepID=UPI000871D251|nr:helix-turn-helix domain-containing protein [Streptomyces oceani]